jgi:hypothetical protein
MLMPAGKVALTCVNRAAPPAYRILSENRDMLEFVTEPGVVRKL